MTRLEQIAQADTELYVGTQLLTRQDFLVLDYAKDLLAAVNAAAVLIRELDTDNDDGMYAALGGVRSALAPLLQEVKP